MRVVGLDVSRTFGEIAYLEEGVVRAGGRVTLLQKELHEFACTLRRDDEVDHQHGLRHLGQLVPHVLQRLLKAGHGARRKLA